MTGATDAVETEGLVSTEAVDGDLLKDPDGKTEGNARPDAVPTERQMALGIEVVRERVGDGVSMAWSEKAQIVETGSPVRRDGPPGLSVATEHTTLPERIETAADDCESGRCRCRRSGRETG